MGDNDITRIAQIFLAVIGVALIAELVSGGAQTGKVLGSGGSALSRMICVATSPVTGSNCGASVALKFGANSGIVPDSYCFPGTPGCQTGAQ